MFHGTHQHPITGVLRRNTTGKDLPAELTVDYQLLSSAGACDVEITPSKSYRYDDLKMKDDRDESAAESDCCD